jgi:hypothetical protein
MSKLHGPTLFDVVQSVVLSNDGLGIVPHDGGGGGGEGETLA